MTFYKDEKKRLGRVVYAIIIAVLMLYYGQIQGQIPRLDFRQADEVPALINFTNSFFIYGCFLLPIYLNEKLFFIKERGESVYLLSKYTVTPLSRKEIYTAKFRILIKNMLLFFFCCVAVYFLVLFSNDYWLLNAEVICSILKGFMWITCFTASETALYIYKGIHLEKAAVS